MVQISVYVKTVVLSRSIIIPAVTAVVPCVRQSKRKCGWMPAEDVLDAPYFHLVFTVPDILNPVIYSNQKLLYDTLYHAASATLQELTSDPKHLGASVGYICILHTWGSEMNFHPHIHMILLGGGLTPKNEWKDNGTEFFLLYGLSPKYFVGNIWMN